MLGYLCTSGFLFDHLSSGEDPALREVNSKGARKGMKGEFELVRPRKECQGLLQLH